MASPRTRLTPKAFEQLKDKVASKKKAAPKGVTPVEASSMNQLLSELGVPAARFKGRVRTSTKSPERAHALHQLFEDEAPLEIVKPRRRGVSVSPIKDSLKSPQISAQTEIGPRGPTLSLWFSGARVLTVNELISIFQFRRFETYQYKDRWKELVQLGVDELTRNQLAVPFFDGPTRLILYRRGTRAIDLDSFQTVFKYAIDGLRKAGILSDDNPFIVVETCPVQYLGPPSIGLRLERLMDWVGEAERDVHQEWFNRADPHEEAIEVHRAKKEKRDQKLKPKRKEAEELPELPLPSQNKLKNPVRAARKSKAGVEKKAISE